MKNSFIFLKNSKGQIAVEYVLLMVIITAISIATHNYLASSKTLEKYIQHPWAHVAGMIETGVWADTQSARAKHPGKIYRHLSLQGEAE